MKKTLCLFFTAIAFVAESFVFQIFASETDDLPTGATPVVINGSASSSIGFTTNNYTDNVDWFSFTTTVDGMIKLAVTPSSGLNTTIDLYDSNRETFIRWATFSGGPGIIDSLVYEKLMAGTYYVKIQNFNYTFGSYTLSNIFTPTAIPNGNDAENNDEYTNAVQLSVNNSKTGHLGYYGNNYVDYSDWYKITTLSDGKIMLVVTPESTLNSSIDIYDVNGTTHMRWPTFNGVAGKNDTLIYENLMAGTYFIRVVNMNYSYGSYTLSNTFTLTAIPNGNDAENNDEFQRANQLTINTPKTGHLGYYGNNYVDNADWYSVNIYIAGKYTFDVKPEKSLKINIDLYKSDGVSHLSWCTLCGNLGESTAITYNFTNPGVYYLLLGKVGYGSYTLNHYQGDYTSLMPNSVKDGTVSIYPNPCDEMLLIDSEEEIKLLTVYDAIGKQVAKIDGKGRTTICLETEKYLSGVYILSIDNNSGKHTDIKMIKK